MCVLVLVFVIKIENKKIKYTKSGVTVGFGVRGMASDGLKKGTFIDEPHVTRMWLLRH